LAKEIAASEPNDKSEPVLREENLIVDVSVKIVGCVALCIIICIGGQV